MATRRERVVLELQDEFTGDILRAASATALLNRELKSLDGKSVRSLDRDTQSLGRTTRSTDRDVSSLGRTTDRTGASIDRLSGRVRIFADLAAILGPSLVPIGALAVPAISGLAAQFGFAALGAGTAIGAFQGVGDALKAMNKANLEPTAANLQAAQIAMEQISPAAQDMVEKLRSLGPALKGLRDEAAGGMFPGVIEGIDALQRRLPDVQRVIGAVAGELGSIASDTGASLASARWDDFFKFLETDAPSALHEMAQAAGNTGHALAEMWMAFDPLNDDFSRWLVRVTADFDRWSQGLSQSNGFAEFIDYIETTGPQVAATMGAIGSAALQIVEATAPLGGPVLQGLEAVFRVIASIADSDLGTPIFAGIAALALYNRALSLTGKLSIAAFMSGPVATNIKRQGAAVGSLRKDWAAYNAVTRTAQGRAQSTGAQMIASRAASERLGKTLRTTGVAAGKAGALVGGLALLSSGAADKIGITNTASLALMGTMAGPWGAALGAAAGAAIDLGHANDDLRDAVTSAQVALNSGDVSQMSKQYDDLAASIKKTNDVGFWDPRDADAGLKKITAYITGAMGEAEKQQAALSGGLSGAAAFGSANGLAQIAKGFQTTAAGARGASQSVTEFRDSVLAANAALTRQGTLDAYTASLLDARAALKENGATLDRNTRQGLANRGALRSMTSSALEYANNMQDADRRTRFLDRSRNDFIVMAQSMGKTLPQAQRMADAFGLINKGAASSSQSLGKLQSRINGLKSKIVEAKANGAKESDEDIQKLRAQIRVLKGKQVDVKESGAGPARDRIQAMRDEITKLKPKTVQADEKGAAAARARIAALRAAIESLRNKTVTTTLVTQRINRGATGNAGKGAAADVVARGGMFLNGAQVFANGGFGDVANRHQAEIAPGSPRHRVWAEEETKGEAYIPLANDDRRPRARAIAAETVGLLGGTAYFAQGGVSFATGGTNTAGNVSVTFPSPVIYRTAVAAANQIAVSAAYTARSATETRAAKLEDLHASQRIIGLQRDLAERTKKTVGKGKRRHEVTGGYALVGFDRTVAAAELADAKLAKLEQRAQLRANALAAIAEQRKTTADTLSGAGDVFSRGSSPRAAIASVNRTISDIASYGQVVASLKSKGASPALLAQVVAKAEGGDFRSAVNIGKALLAQPELLGQLNASLATLGSVSANVAAVTSDPRFLSTKAWNPTGQVVTSRQATVTIAADPSTWMPELRRQVVHDVTMAMVGS